MKPFDLELAKKGHPVCTRDGRDARIICFDRITREPETRHGITGKVWYGESGLTILFLIKNSDSNGNVYEEQFGCYENGFTGRGYCSPRDNPMPQDLFMKEPEKKIEKRWGLFYKENDSVYDYVEGRAFKSPEELISFYRGSNAMNGSEIIHFDVEVSHETSAESKEPEKKTEKRYLIINKFCHQEWIVASDKFFTSRPEANEALREILRNLALFWWQYSSYKIIEIEV